MKRILITGCARSGTGFMARLLNSIGIKTGHENVFYPGAPSPVDWGEFQAESSWIAGNRLTDVPSDTVVVHLHRLPELVIRSHCELRFFDDSPPRHHLPYLQLAKLAIPNYDQLTPHDRAEAYWINWNRFVMNSATRFTNFFSLSIHELIAMDVRKIAAAAGYEISHDIREKMLQIGFNVNHKLYDKPTLLPTAELQSSAARQLSQDLGYK